MRERGIVPLLAMRNTKHGSGLGRWRWVVERTFAWLNQFRRLRVRYEKRADIHEAFLALACALLCWNALQKDAVHLRSGRTHQLLSLAAFNNFRLELGGIRAFKLIMAPQSPKQKAARASCLLTNDLRPNRVAAL